MDPYSYANNSPVTFSDPSGLKPMFDDLDDQHAWQTAGGAAYPDVTGSSRPERAPTAPLTAPVSGPPGMPSPEIRPSPHPVCSPSVCSKLIEADVKKILEFLMSLLPFSGLPACLVVGTWACVGVMLDLMPMGKPIGVAVDMAKPALKKAPDVVKPFKGLRCHSFDAATPVLMADGTTKQINDGQVGDKVMAADPETGQTQAKPVTASHINQDIDLTDLTVTVQNGGDEGEAGQVTVKTTQHHPFWDATDGRWSDAAELEPGHELLVYNDNTEQLEVGTVGSGQGSPPARVTVTEVRNYIGLKTMRDLTVASIHTYYVVAGDTPVLVHNCGGYDLRGKDPISIVPDNAEVRWLKPDPNGGAQYGVEFKWKNDAGQTVRLRAHGPDGTAPAGSNAAIGDTFRVSIAGRYQDIAGNLFHKHVHNPNSPFYDPAAANATHIPWPSEFPGL